MVKEINRSGPTDKGQLMNDNLLNDDQEITIDPNKNYLEELVGDGKKFKSLEDLARGKYESDLYIRNKEKAFDDLSKDYLNLSSEYKARASLEEVIDKLSNQKLASSDLANEDTNKPVYDPKEIESLVSSKIQEHELTKKQQDNFNIIRNKLKERFGENHQKVLREQMERLGLTEEFTNDLAKKHPSVFIKTFGLDEQQNREDSFQAPMRSNQRSDSFAPRTNARTWSYYQKMKRDNPTLYLNPKTQVQMHKDAVDLGDAFADGDWNAL